MFISTPTSPVPLTIAKQYIGAYMDLHEDEDKIRIWREKISQKSGFAKMERICKHYTCFYGRGSFLLWHRCDVLLVCTAYAKSDIYDCLVLSLFGYIAFFMHRGKSSCMASFSS